MSSTALQKQSTAFPRVSHPQRRFIIAVPYFPGLLWLPNPRLHLILDKITETMSSQIPYLPTEIRLGIVEALLEDGCRLAPLATVSRDWQEVVEPYTFSHIKLTTERAGQFASMTRRNRAHIRYIWVSLEIRDYDCIPCLKDRGWGVRQAMNEANRVLVASALRDLFAALSEWEPTSSLVLDFGVDSPCDPKEWFKYRASGLDESDDEDDEGRCPEEGWTPQFYGPHPRIPYRLNVFEHIMQGSFFGRDPLKEQICWHLLPQAPAVTGVLLREQGSIQCRPTALRCLLSRFPRLEEIYCEPRTLWYSKTSARGLGGESPLCPHNTYLAAYIHRWASMYC